LFHIVLVSPRDRASRPRVLRAYAGDCRHRPPGPDRSRCLPKGGSGPSVGAQECSRATHRAVRWPPRRIPSSSAEIDMTAEAAETPKAGKRELLPSVSSPLPPRCFAVPSPSPARPLRSGTARDDDDHRTGQRPFRARIRQQRSPGWNLTDVAFRQSGTKRREKRPAPPRGGDARHEKEIGASVCRCNPVAGGNGG